VRAKAWSFIFLLGLLAAQSGAASSPQPPPNDRRVDAQPLAGLPAHVTGSTVGAGTESSDPPLSCGAVAGTVWFRFRAGASGANAVRLRARGQLEAIVAVYRRDRSHLAGLGCSRTDGNGLAGARFPVRAGRTYLVLVAQKEGSIPGRFDLRVVKPESLEAPPGTPLPAGGAWAGVDRLLDPDDVWSVDLQPGTLYRINLIHHAGRCLLLRLYRPGITDFRGEEPLRAWNCPGYETFTPGPDGGGRYFLRVRPALSYRGTQAYRLSVAAAEPDDAAPGVFLRSGSQVAGSLSPRTNDVVDLYRFVVPRPGVLAADIADPPKAVVDMLVLTEDGRVVKAKADQAGPFKLRLQLAPEHYYLALRAERGAALPYHLTFFVRDITSNGLLADGLVHDRVVPNGTVALTAQVSTTTGSPAAGASGGMMRFQLDRLDPFAGWNFVQLERITVGGDGVARLSWAPPTPGRWRAHAVFFGTDTTSPSSSKYVLIDVEEPLEQP